MVYVKLMGKPQFFNRWFGGKNSTILKETPIFVELLFDNTTLFGFDPKIGGFYPPKKDGV